MNALIPAFLAVLLAELGQRSIGLGAREHRPVILAAALLLIGVAVAGGAWVATVITSPARMLLLGIALLIGAAGQLSRDKMLSDSRSALLVRIWASSTAFLAFAFAARMNAPVSAGAGSAVGLIAAVAASRLLQTERPAAIPPVRKAAAGLLMLVGVFASLSGLRIL